MQPRFWSALYQQQPAPDSGTYFESEWLKSYTQPEGEALKAWLKTLSVDGGSDYAVTSEGGDYTVHAIVGVDPKDNLYLLDIWREQAASDRWVESWCDLVIKWKPIGWAEESGQIKSGVGPFLTQRARQRKAYCARTPFTTSRGDKSIRAQSIRGRMALNGLYVPTSASWFPAFRSELMSFPAGKHDDAVDAIGLVGQLLDLMTKGRAQKEEKPTERDAYQPIKSRVEHGDVLTM